jgi:hypothetical protein
LRHNITPPTSPLRSTQFTEVIWMLEVLVTVRDDDIPATRGGSINPWPLTSGLIFRWPIDCFYWVLSFTRVAKFRFFSIHKCYLHIL